MAARSNLPLKNLFSKFDFTVDRKLAESIIRWKIAYETRDTHSDALNTPLLGCAKIGFFNKDSQALFDILHVNRDDFKQAVRQSSVDPNFQVASDEYNLLTVYAIHRFMTSTLQEKIRNEAVKALVFMLLVKFFSSLMRHYLPYGANQGVMELTIDSLSDKFDIKHKETSTWKLVMEARAEEMITPGNIHWNAFMTFIPDNKVTYVITDLQTRIRTKVRLIMSIYYDMIKRERTIASTMMTGETPAGKKVVNELNNSFDSMISTISNRAINAQQFIVMDYVRLCSKLVPNVREDLMKNMLMTFSSAASLQYQKKQGDLLSKDKSMFLGYHILIQNIIQCSYRDAIVKKVNLKNRWDILKNALNLYRSSRVNDKKVGMIKLTVERIIVGKKFSSRDATNASLKIAFIAYIMLMSFDCD